MAATFPNLPMSGPKAVHKYQFQVGDQLALGLPSGSKVVHVAEQYRMPTFWLETEPGAVPLMRRTFKWFGTGHQIPSDSAHQGTMIDSAGYVWHLYELL